MTLIEILQHLADEESNLETALRDVRTCRDVLLSKVQDEDKPGNGGSVVEWSPPPTVKTASKLLHASQAKVLAALEQVESMTTTAVQRRTKLPMHVVRYALGKLVASRRAQLTKLGAKSIWAAV